MRACTYGKRTGLKGPLLLSHGGHGAKEYGVRPGREPPRRRSHTPPPFLLCGDEASSPSPPYFSSVWRGHRNRYAATERAMPRRAPGGWSPGAPVASSLESSSATS